MSEDSVANVKAWLSPILMSILGVMIWHDINEMKADIKEMAKKDTATQVQIYELKRDIDFLQRKVYLGNTKDKFIKKEDEDEILNSKSDE